MFIRIFIVMSTLSVLSCVFESSNTKEDQSTLELSDGVSFHYTIDVRELSNSVTGIHGDIVIDGIDVLDTTNLELTVDSIIVLPVTYAVGSEAIVSYTLIGVRGYLAQQVDTISLRNIDSLTVIQGKKPNAEPLISFTSDTLVAYVNTPVYFQTNYSDDDLMVDFYLACTGKDSLEHVRIDPANKVCVYQSIGVDSAVVQIRDAFHIGQDIVIVNIVAEQIAARDPGSSNQIDISKGGVSSVVVSLTSSSMVPSVKESSSAGVTLGSSSSTLTSVHSSATNSFISSQVLTTINSSSGIAFDPDTSISVSSSMPQSSTGSMSSSLSSVISSSSSSSTSSQSSSSSNSSSSSIITNPTTTLSIQCQVEGAVTTCGTQGDVGEPGDYPSTILNRSIGEVIEVTVNENLGYVFSGWACLSEDVSCQYNSNSGITNVTLKKTSATITAKYMKKDYGITIRKHGEGRVDLGINNPVDDGHNFLLKYLDSTLINITETFPEAYTWGGWSVGANLTLSYPQTEKLNYLRANGTGEITAVFNPKTFDIGVASDHGTVTIDGGTSSTYSYLFGTAVPVSIDTAFGWSFNGWNETNVTIQNNRLTAIDPYTSSWNLGVNFMPATYSIGATATNGSVEFTDGSSDYVFDTQEYIKAIPALGYRFNRWVPHNVTLNSTQQDETYISTIADVNPQVWNVEAEFVTVDNSIILLIQGGLGAFKVNGNLHSASTVTFVVGNPKNLEIIPGPGFEFDRWILSDVVLANQTTNTSIESITARTGLQITALLKPVNNGVSGVFTAYHNGVASRDYSWVKIGSQVWMQENLEYDYGINGESNPDIYDKCINNASTCPGQGRLYTIDVIESICPDGWSLPTDSEWQTLETSIGVTKTDTTANAKYRATAYGKYLKKPGTSWVKNPGDASSLFNAIPSGYYNFSTGGFSSITLSAYFWAGKNGDNIVRRRVLKSSTGYTGIERTDVVSAHGYSMRCIY